MVAKENEVRGSEAVRECKGHAEIWRLRLPDNQKGENHKYETLRMHQIRNRKRYLEGKMIRERSRRN
jgi:hypothetical protein